MTRHKHTLPTTDHEKLNAQEWLPDTQPAGVVCLLHGLGEHSGRYARMAQVLTAAGFALSALDLRGHGESPGQRGHVQSYEVFMEDIQCLLADAARRFPGKPLFLYGQSLGGNLALNFVLRRKPDLAGVVVTAPWLRLAFEPPGARVLLAKVMSRIWPAFSHVCGRGPAALSRDPAVVEQYAGDPLTHDLISARLFVEASRAGLWAMEHAAEFSLPLLIMHGSADQLTAANASRQFADRARRCCAAKIWDGAYHELHNEPESEAVLAYILAWLKDQMEPEQGLGLREFPLLEIPGQPHALQSA